MRIRKLLVMSIVGLSLGLTGCGSQKATSGNVGKELNIICWSEYLPDEVVRDYEEASGVKINLTTYSSSDEMLAKVQSSAKDTYDMIIGTGVNTSILCKQDFLAELDKSKIPNAENIDPLFMSTPNDPENKYSVPYLYTSVVIAVNQDKIKEPIKSYKDLLKPAYKDSIVIIEDPRSVITIGMIANGYDGGEVTDELLSKSRDYLEELKPNIHAFNGDSAKTLLINEECPIGVTYGGECALAMEQNPSIVGVYPEEGIYCETDMMMKTKEGKNGEEVEPFINYICDGEVSAKISQYFPYVNPNKAAKDYLDEAHLSNPIRNIPEEELENAKTVMDIGDDLNKIVQLWAEFKG